MELMERSVKKFKINWKKRFLEAFLDHLRGKLFKLAIKKILGIAMMGGIKGWIIQFILTELYDQIGRPVIRLGMRKIQKQIDEEKGKKLYKDIEKAKDREEFLKLSQNI